jgi:membrane-bound PQQ-dependent dehydrogenase (glucose/quinate/shikimate family)
MIARSDIPAGSKSLLWLLGLLFLICGLFLTVGGIYLVMLQGSPYFALMGASMMVSGICFIYYKPFGAWLYGISYLFTIGWAIWEVGLDFWPLVSRLALLGGLAMLVAFAYPSMVNSKRRRIKRNGGYKLGGIIALLLVIAVGSAFIEHANIEATVMPEFNEVAKEELATDWRQYANTTRGTRFSGADRINKDNVNKLAVAWQFNTGDIPGNSGAGAEDQNTPLQIDDKVFVCTPNNIVYAIDADTGQQIWRFDPKATAPNWERCRGLAYYEDRESATMLTPQGGDTDRASDVMTNAPLDVERDTSTAVANNNAAGASLNGASGAPTVAERNTSTAVTDANAAGASSNGASSAPTVAERNTSTAVANTNAAGESSNGASSAPNIVERNISTGVANTNAAGASSNGASSAPTVAERNTSTTVANNNAAGASSNGASSAPTIAERNTSTAVAGANVVDATAGVDISPALKTAICPRRLFMNTIDARLVALNLETGELCSDFGENGVVDLKKHMGEIKPGFYEPTAAPLVAGNVVVVGGRIADNYSTDEPGGVVRAYDVHSGNLVWAWDPGNPTITGTPPEGQTYTRATVNVWATLAYDADLDLIYAPTGNATPDFWAGERTELDDKYSSSIVAIEGQTGKVRWTYQTVHHDLWDYDLPAQPLLYDIPVGQGKTLPALVQVTKQGEIFLLNRQTGQPLAAVEERPVVQGNVAGERYSPTQPFSVGMPSIGNQTLIESDMWGATPFDQLMCRIDFMGSEYHGLFTPPGMTKTLQYPGSLGGMNWGSVSIDPTTSYMFVNDMRIGLTNWMIPRGQIKAGASGIEMGVVPQEGTPFGAMRLRFMSPLGVPCQKPPYGTLSAIDLKSRRLVWQVPVGTVMDTGIGGIPMRLPIPIGMPTLGGSMATQSGLLFFAGTQDFYLRAYDSATGKEIWKDRLPVGSQGTPITYISPKTNKQYIVISASGARQSPVRGDYVIAYALAD